MIEEPFVKVKTMDFSALQARVPDSLNIGLVVDSDDGPVGITQVTSQVDFVKDYLSGNQLNPTDSETCKHAFKLLQFMPIYVTRSMDNSIFGGITNNGDTIYTDTDFNIMKYYKQLKFVEAEASFKSVYMKLKITGTSDSLATLVYSGDAPNSLVTLSDNNAILPAKDNFIFDTITEKYYKIIEVSGTTASVEEAVFTDVGDNILFTYSFGVNFKKKFTIPTYEEMYAPGTLVKVVDNYYTIISGNEVELHNLNNVELTQNTFYYDSNFPVGDYISITSGNTTQYYSIDQVISPVSYAYNLSSATFKNAGEITIENNQFTTENDDYDENDLIIVENLTGLSYYRITAESGSGPYTYTVSPVTVNSDDSALIINNTYISNSIYDIETYLKVESDYYSITNRTQHNDYFYIVSPKSSVPNYVLELKNTIQVAADPVNLLNMLVGYNSIDLSGTGLSKFYTISDSDGEITVTITNKVTLVEIGYRLKNSKEFNKLDIDSLLESSKYRQFLGSQGSNLGGYSYLSINGFTYFSTDVSSSNNPYPYINVNFGENSMSICKFFTYIFDYQLSNNANIEPVSLETKVGLLRKSGSTTTIEFHDGFSNKFSSNEFKSTSSECNLIDNSKVKGYAIVNNNGIKTIYYTDGYDSSPIDDITPGNSMFDDNGNYTIHTTGKLLYAIANDFASDFELNEDSDFNTRILYSDKLLESVENNTDVISGPDIASNNFKYSFIDDASILGNRTYGGLQLIIDDYLFYVESYSTNNPDLTPVKLSSAKLTYIQFIRHLRRIVGNYFNCIDTEFGLTLMTNDPDEFSTIDWKKNDGIIMEDPISTNNAGIVTSAKFAIINKCPSKKKNLMFSLTQNSDDPELWDLVITRKTEETSYTISFIKDKVDGYGRNVYYTYVNQLNKYIQLIELEGEDPILNGTYTSNLFGDEVPIASPESDDFVNAVNRFKENVGIYYDFIFDAGYANMVYAKGIFEVCKEIYAEGLLTMPYITDPAQLISYRDSCGIDTEEGWRCIMRGNWIDDTTVADFVIRMSPMCAYVEKIVNNKSRMSEFAPVFGASNGSITYNPGFYISKKNIREELLTHQIPVIIDDKSLGLKYWNLDTTLKVVDSSLCDVNNCRMINIGAHICDNQCKWYIGKFNTEPLRTEVTNALTNQLSDRLIKNQQYPLAGLRVICNSSNNPVSVVENRELVVDVAYQFTPGIRYINVFQKVYKLSQDLNEL